MIEFFAEPAHAVIALSGVLLAMMGALVVRAGLAKIMRKELLAVELVTVAQLEKYLDDRLKRHEEWEQKLNQTGRDVLRELIESYHRQGLDAVDQARRISVRVASDSQALQDHLRRIEGRVDVLEKRGK